MHDGERVRLYDRLEVAGRAVEPDALADALCNPRLHGDAMKAEATRLASEASHALGAWAQPWSTRVEWREAPVTEIDIEGVGDGVLRLIDRAHHGRDGHPSIFGDTTPDPFEEALDRGVRRIAEQIGTDTWLDATKEILFRHRSFLSAVAWTLSVPAESEAFAGARFEDTPNPFAPALALLATGYVLERIDSDGIVLVIPRLERG